MNELFSGTSLEVLTNQLERVRKQIKEQEQVIAQLRYDCQVIIQQFTYLHFTLKLVVIHHQIIYFTLTSASIILKPVNIHLKSIKFVLQRTL